MLYLDTKGMSPKNRLRFTARANFLWCLAQTLVSSLGKIFD
jgi:hypothetical protein